MTIDINELRRLASRYIGISVSSPVSPKGLIELLDRLEAAEKLNAEWLKANAPGGWIDELRAKVERMERDLRLIAETDPVDAALDPQRAVRIARAALEESK